MIKTFFGYLTQIDYDIGLISIQKLNKRLANTNLLNFYKALIFYGKSKTYKIVKELLGIIALNCQREKSSTRDKEQLKDFPTLVYTINNFWNDPKNFFAKA